MSDTDSTTPPASSSAPSPERIELRRGYYITASPRDTTLWRIYNVDGCHIGAISGHLTAVSFAADLASPPSPPDQIEAAAKEMRADLERLPKDGGKHGCFIEPQSAASSDFDVMLRGHVNLKSLARAALGVVAKSEVPVPNTLPVDPVARSGDEWQTIESVPKDGSEIDLACRSMVADRPNIFVGMFWNDDGLWEDWHGYLLEQKWRPYAWSRPRTPPSPDASPSRQEGS